MSLLKANLEMFLCLLMTGVVWPVGHGAEAFEEPPWRQDGGMQARRAEGATAGGWDGYPEPPRREGRYRMERDGLGREGARGFPVDPWSRPWPEARQPSPHSQDARGYGVPDPLRDAGPSQVWEHGPGYGGMRRPQEGPRAPRPGRAPWNETLDPAAPYPGGQALSPDARGYRGENREAGPPSRWEEAEREPAAHSLYSRNALLEKQASSPVSRAGNARVAPSGIPWR